MNAVDDLGMDPTGSEPIDSALSAAYETGTLIEFPPGDYRVETETVIGPRASKSRFGMVGLGDSHKDVQFHFPNGDKEYDGYWFIHQDGGEDCVLANFSIQMTDDHVTSINVRFDCADGALIQDVEWLGFVPTASHSYGQLLTCYTPEDSGATTDSVNTLRRVTIGRGGAALAGHRSRTGTPPGTTYIRVYPDHVGEIVVEDLHLEQSGGNAFRSTNNDGVITVKGGLFKNNDISNLRLQGGNHPEKRSTVTGARVVVDHGDVPYPTGENGFFHGMGINIDSRVGGTDLLIEDCEFICNEIDIKDQTDGKPHGLIRLTRTGSSNPGGVTIRNTKIYNNTRMQTLWFQRAEDGANEPIEVTLDNVNITVDHDTQTEGAVCVINERDGSRITDSCIHAPNGTIDGIAFTNCDNVVVEDSNINVGGEAVDLTDTDGNIRNISHSDSCPLPSQSDTDDGSDDSSDDSDDDGLADDGWTSFVIDGFDSDTRGEYEFVVHGEARENTELSEYGTVGTVESIDDDRTRVAGAMRSGVDAFDYDGCIESFAAGPDMNFERDGEEISRDEIVDCDHDLGNDDEEEDGDDTNDDQDEDDDAPTNGEWQSFVINGLDSNTSGEYEFVVYGNARENTELSEYGTVSTVESVDDDRTRVAGEIWSGVDAFDYDGCIESYAAGPDMNFERDGEEISRDDIVDCDHDLGDDDEEEEDGDDTSDDQDEDDDAPTNGEWKSFVIDGFDSNTSGEYEFVVYGDARENTELSEYGTVSTVEAIDGGKTRVAGEMWSGVDAFDYDGCIESYAAGPDMRFERDGEEISRDEIVDCDHEVELDHTLWVMGTGTTSSFNVTVDGNLISDPSCEISCEDSISGSSAEDAVNSETAKFQFDGEITDFSLDGEAGIYLDGNQVDPELLGTEEDPVLPNWLTVDGLEDETSYQFSVTGNLYKSPDLGPVEADDVITDGMVIGSVTDDVDGYRFSGDLTMLRVQGTADVQFDEE
ncbi:hypothetical protein [Halalkaliarchaeum sp. AArc-CO]|uniref:hypothetical protein n=1 Tax=Halalkaliarchaeum sp. AArc-CO TaxID=2866381 RepID=UPI00217D13CD|nr:hypothetical protein [Halalkaliarchaeum sp. AArc-CO]